MIKKTLTTLTLVVFSSLQLFAQTSIVAGDLNITSKLMTFHQNIYVARGGLEITKEDMYMTADRGIYDRDIEIVKAFDNVKVTQPGSVLNSDYLEAYVKEDRILARGNPKLERIIERTSEDGLDVSKTRAILLCKEVEAFNSENRFLAKGDVHLVEVPYRDGETEEEAKENEENPVSDIKCEILEIFSEEDKAIARENVIIVTETLSATGDRAIYLNLENRIIIVGHAHAIQTSIDQTSDSEQVSELYANKIIYYPDEERTIAVGDVQATVYPGSGSGPRSKKTKEEEREKILEQKERKKRLEEKKAESKSEAETTTSSSAQQDLPPGEYTKISNSKNESSDSDE